FATPARTPERMRAYNRRTLRGNPPERHSLNCPETPHAAATARDAPTVASTRDAAAVAAGDRAQSTAGNAAGRPGHRRPGSAAGADATPAGADRADGLRRRMANSITRHRSSRNTLETDVRRRIINVGY